MQHKEFICRTYSPWQQTFAAMVSYPDNYNPNRTEKYPVFFLFHGLGEIAGSGGYTSAGLLKQSWNLRARLNSGALDWTDAIFVQPQISYGSGNVWNENQLQEFIEVILGIRAVPAGQPTTGTGGLGVDGYHYYNIDRSKIHIAGISLGGQAITKLVAKNPADFFRTVIHLSAINDVINTPAAAGKVRRFWGRHSLNDTTVYPSALDRWTNNLTLAGNSIAVFENRPATGAHSGWEQELARTGNSQVNSIYTFAFLNSVTPEPEPPDLVSTLPANEATEVLTTLNSLQLTLSKTATKGTGNIVLTNTTDSSSVNIAVASTTITGETIAIPVTLLAGKSYQVTIPNTAFIDADGLAFAGTSWMFATKPADVIPDPDPEPEPEPEPTPHFNPAYDIFRNGLQVGRIRPASGDLTKAIMGVDAITMAFTNVYYLPLQIGDYTTAFNQTYKLNRLPDVVKKSEREYQYNMQLEALFYDLAKYAFLFLGADNTLTEVDFSLMGNAQVFAQLIVDNANRVDGGWELGEIEETETINLTFSAENCLGALNRIATEFKTEFWVEGKIINISKRATVTALEFSYGQGNGLYELQRTNIQADVYTRLYAYGSEKNLLQGYRSGSRRLRLPSDSFLESNVAAYGVIEKSIIFEDIYPKRIGTVTAVNSFDNFTDATIDFNVNSQLLPGIVPKVSFLTGQLAGYDLEISFNNGQKSFKLFKNQDEKALEVPSEFLAPAVGDQYVLIDIAMPETYVTAAENELLAKAQEDLEFNSSPRVQYALKADIIHLKRNNIQPQLFDTVRVLDSVMQIDKTIRIVSITRSIVDLFNYSAVQLSESVAPAAIVRQALQAQDLERAMINNRLYDVNKQRFGWRTSQEAIKAAFDTSGDVFNESIKPVIVETAGLIVGQESQQFTLVNILFHSNYNGDPNAFLATSGKLVHFTINDNNTIREWNLTAFSRTDLTPSLYYMYARCEKVGSAGTFILSTQQIKTAQDPTYYHFLIGSLSAPIGNVREPSFSYGLSVINGKFIKTGKISSQDGGTYIDLDNGEIRGALTFSNGQSVQTVVNQTAATAKSEAIAAAALDAQTKANDAKIAAQDYALVEAVLKREQAKAYADGIVSDEEQARIDQATANLQAAALDAQQKADAAEQAASHLANQAQQTANGAVSVAGMAVQASADAVNQAANAKATADNVADKTNFLTSGIDGNVLWTGTALLGDALGNNNAFISGVIDNGLNSVAIGVGDGGYANKNNVPFRVTQAGKLFSSDAVIGPWTISEVGMIYSAAQSWQRPLGLDIKNNDGVIEFVRSYDYHHPSGAILHTYRKNIVGTEGCYFEGDGINIDSQFSVGYFRSKNSAKAAMRVYNSDGGIALSVQGGISVGGSEGLTVTRGIKIQDAGTGNVERIFNAEFKNGLLVGLTYVG